MASSDKITDNIYCIETATTDTTATDLDQANKVTDDSTKPPLKDDFLSDIHLVDSDSSLRELVTGRETQGPSLRVSVSCRCWYHPYRSTVTRLRSKSGDR